MKELSNFNMYRLETKPEVLVLIVTDNHRGEAEVIIKTSEVTISARTEGAVSK